MLDQILQWAEKNQSVSVLLVVGSMAGGGRKDSLSDYDISVFGEGFDFIEKDDWLNGIARPILCIHEKFFWNEIRIPTRLTIFENFMKVDFSFHSTSLLKNMVSEQRLPETYDAGYKVLLDKDALTTKLPNPSFLAYIKEKPGPQEFDLCVREFWFEAYHVAKYLARKDIWVAKVRDQDMKKWLLTMLEWNVAAKAKFTLHMKRDGKAMNDWIPKLYKSKIKKCFADWDLPSQQSALCETIKLFEMLTQEAAGILQYAYPENVARDITKFIFTLKSTLHDNTKLNRI